MVQRGGDKVRQSPKRIAEKTKKQGRKEEEKKPITVSWILCSEGGSLVFRARKRLLREEKKIKVPQTDLKFAYSIKGKVGGICPNAYCHPILFDPPSPRELLLRKGVVHIHGIRTVGRWISSKVPFFAGRGPLSSREKRHFKGM